MYNDIQTHFELFSKKETIWLSSNKVFHVHSSMHVYTGVLQKWKQGTINIHWLIYSFVINLEPSILVRMDGNSFVCK